ncbi:MAG: uroporphyrinogen decarboxylase [Pirellulaceae bacterium]
MSSPANFNGLIVAALESRRASEMARLIERHGGVARVSPSMREVKLERSPSAVDFAHRLITGEVSTVIFMTGIGFRQTLAAVERHVDRQRFLDTLADVTTVGRGPKVLAAMREVGMQPTHRVPEPNTWREVLTTLDQFVSLDNQTVAVQEYGKANASLHAGLEARGGRVLSVRVYQYDLPEDVEPLRANVRALAAGELDVVMFTSAHQVANLLRVADELGLDGQVRSMMQTHTVVASIGPTTSEMLRDNELPVDLEPEHSKMGHLVSAAAEQARDLLAKKRSQTKSTATITTASPTIMAQPDFSVTAALDATAPWYNSPFMKACRREPTDVTPVWLMRQAGRYMQEYREVRAKTTFLELCKNPGLCSEVMCTAVNRLGVDAAIIFSDLLPILEPLGFDLEFAKGEGPVIHNPIRETADIDRTRELEDMNGLDFVVETVRRTRADLPAHLPVIGFAGAPFTLASYAIEGGSSRDYLNTKSLMYRDEGAWTALMQRLSRAVVLYLNAQIEAGAQCVQLFDSWAGCLGPDDYRRYVLPHVAAIVAGIKPGVPVINFATGNPALLPLLSAAGSAVVGVDWRIRLDEAWRTIGHDRAVQGNMDPLVLMADRDTIRERVAETLRQAGGRPGHIFNLGHGINQHTPVDNAIALVDAVHELSSR